ncbi:MAG: hypothetical protein L3J49_08345 [Desulfobulbaceae bacterium]|nr:hypothetical protein [Desulfobulbaceae bacterium]
MGGKTIRFLLSSTGYLLYTLVVLVGLLWLLFPTESVQAWLEQQLQDHYPGYSWSCTDRCADGVCTWRRHRFDP